MAKKTDSKPGPSASKKSAKPAAAKPISTAAKPKAAVKANATATTTAKGKPAAKKAPAATTNGKRPVTKAATKSVRVPTPAAAAAASTAAQSNAAESEPIGAFFYFLSETIDPQVTCSRPVGQPSDSVERFADFAAVRQHAIDYLVDLIDRCEVRLWQIKRADSLNSLEELVREHEHPRVLTAGEETPCAPS